MDGCTWPSCGHLVPGLLETLVNVLFSGNERVWLGLGNKTSWSGLGKKKLMLWIRNNKSTSTFAFTGGMNKSDRKKIKKRASDT